jgi:hypothetical protein
VAPPELAPFDPSQEFHLSHVINSAALSFVHIIKSSLLGLCASVLSLDAAADAAHDDSPMVLFDTEQIGI